MDLNLPDSMSINEFLHYPEEEIICEELDDNTFIERLIDMYKKPSDIHINDSEIDDSTEPPIVNANDAIKSLELVRSFLQQQEDSKELLKHVNSLDYYIGLKLMNAKKQTTIDNFFSQK